MEEMNLRNYAYLGDAVWELYIRGITVKKTENARDLHKITTDKVNANFQHDLLMHLQDSLSEDEQEIMRRARNLPVPVGRRSNQAVYRMSTAFETLIGWWYETDKARLEEVKEKLSKYL